MKNYYFFVLMFSLIFIIYSEGCKKATYEHDETFYTKSGKAKYDLKDYEGVIEDLDKAIDINSSYSEAYFYRHLAKHKLKDYRGALCDINKLIELEPDLGGAYCNRGITKFCMGDEQGACLDFTRAGELGDDKGYDMVREYCK